MVLQSESLELSQGWTPNPNALSALEGSGLNENDEFVAGCGLHEFYAVACAPQC